MASFMMTKVSPTRKTAGAPFGTRMADQKTSNHANVPASFLGLYCKATNE
jgi:hypothetical protein